MAENFQKLETNVNPSIQNSQQGRGGNLKNNTIPMYSIINSWKSKTKSNSL